MDGKKTYLFVICGLISSIALFVGAGDYSFDAIMKLVQVDSVLGAMAALRIALSKKA